MLHLLLLLLILGPRPLPRSLITVELRSSGGTCLVLNTCRKHGHVGSKRCPTFLFPSFGPRSAHAGSLCALAHKHLNTFSDTKLQDIPNFRLLLPLGPHLRVPCAPGLVASLIMLRFRASCKTNHRFSDTASTVKNAKPASTAATLSARTGFWYRFRPCPVLFNLPRAAKLRRYKVHQPCWNWECRVLQTTTSSVPARCM